MSEQKLIDAEEALDVLQKGLPMVMKSTISNLLVKVPTADAEPVVHAHWKMHDNGNKPWTCSSCGSGCLLNYESDWCLSESCPHCGAKMDEEE